MLLTRFYRTDWRVWYASVNLFILCGNAFAGLETWNFDRVQANGLRREVRGGEGLGARVG